MVNLSPLFPAWTFRGLGWGLIILKMTKNGNCVECTAYRILRGNDMCKRCNAQMSFDRAAVA